MNTSVLVEKHTQKSIKPQFIEGTVFKTILPLPDFDESEETNSKIEGTNSKTEGVNIDDIVNDIVNDTVSEIIKQRMVRLVLLLLKNPGKKTDHLSSSLGVSRITIIRDIQKISELVHFQGTPKTGGYYLTPKMKQKLSEGNL